MLCCLSTSRVVSTTDRYLLLPVSRVEDDRVRIATFVHVTSSNLVQSLKVVHRYPFFQLLCYKANENFDVRIREEVAYTVLPSVKINLIGIDFEIIDLGGLN